MGQVFQYESVDDYGALRVKITCPRCKQMHTGNPADIEEWRIDHNCDADINPYVRLRNSIFLPELLAAVMDATAADFGNVQLFDPAEQVLRIAAHHGFSREFLDYFDLVGADDCACGSAMTKGSRVIVTDTASDPIFSNESRGVMLRANARSVQSTPLIARSHNLIGVVSTHFERPRPFSERELKRVDAVIGSYLQRVD